ncbi:MAG: hypothetical protein NZ770_08355, partial [Candidatus Poseidoniaceae archaeon]|nr:hypothetical protein [Candidatus Poseidoniaceae archaeon]
SNRSIAFRRRGWIFFISPFSSPDIQLLPRYQQPVDGRRKTDEAPSFRQFMAEHEVVIEWQGSDSHRSSIIAVAESIEEVELEETGDGLKFVFKSLVLKDLRMVVDAFLEECAKIEQG